MWVCLCCLVGLLIHISIQVIEILGYTVDRVTDSLHFWMPFITWSLFDLLANPSFSPHPSPVPGPHKSNSDFIIITSSVLHQILGALAYLHSQSIAHRDIKPRNVLITRGGNAVLIDFGIAWDSQMSPSKDAALWLEPVGQLCPHVCSGYVIRLFQVRKRLTMLAAGLTVHQRQFLERRTTTHSLLTYGASESCVRTFFAHLNLQVMTIYPMTVILIRQRKTTTNLFHLTLCQMIFGDDVDIGVGTVYSTRIEAPSDWLGAYSR
jgi:serine/threonine protein kinase